MRAIVEPFVGVHIQAGEGQPAREQDGEGGQATPARDQGPQHELHLCLPSLL